MSRSRIPGNAHARLSENVQISPVWFPVYFEATSTCLIVIGLDKSTIVVVILYTRKSLLVYWYVHKKKQFRLLGEFPNLGGGVMQNPATRAKCR